MILQQLMFCHRWKFLGDGDCQATNDLVSNVTVSYVVQIAGKSLEKITRNTHLEQIRSYLFCSVTSIYNRYK